MEKYTLVIAEKPDTAERIASALDANEKPRKIEDHRVPYYVARRDRKLVVVPALGHLYTVVAENKGRNQYPVFSFKWAPRSFAERNAGLIRTWLQVIAKLAKDADMFIDACDYDIEGSIIGYNILRYACEGKERVSRRMKYSTLTKEELEKAYIESSPHLAFALVEAGLARHEVDWLYGINLTRALTTAAKKSSGLYATLSTGRVQGPTLRFLAAREETIKSFVPTPYWQVEAQIDIGGHAFKAEYEKGKIEIRKEAIAVFNACRGRDGKVEKISIRRSEQLPPFPFDLGALQGEAYRLFGYTPKRTSNLAQHLYIDGLISYPRTSSQKLPPFINYGIIIENLAKVPQYRRLASELLVKWRLTPYEGTKEDLAHPAIYPTGNMPARTLDVSERNLLDLVVKRFLAVFSEPAISQTVKAQICINEHRFYFEGRNTLKEGWLRFYEPYGGSGDVTVPKMREGETLNIKKLALQERFTNAPPRYNPCTILKRMEQAEIGTKATRADVIQTIYARKYIRGERMVVTDLGFGVLEVLEKYCPTVVSIRLTRELEEKMNGIQTLGEKRENVLTETVGILGPAMDKLKENEKAIGDQLSNAVKASRLEERTIGTCPICKTGKLTMLRSKKTGKRFAGCTNYFIGLCRASFPLPQHGIVKPFEKSCPVCVWPRIQVKTSGKRVWTLCLNPDCPSKKQKGKAL